jgi:acyl-coenzyme A thioesterase PaaI-like protein
LPQIDHHGKIVEYVGDGDLRRWLPFNEASVGRDTWMDEHGGLCVSGRMVMELTDAAMYACIRATYGAEAVGSIQMITLNFLRSAASADGMAQVQMVRWGKRSLSLETYPYSEGVPEPMTHVTVTAVLRYSSGSDTQTV